MELSLAFAVLGGHDRDKVFRVVLSVLDPCLVKNPYT